LRGPKLWVENNPPKEWRTAKDHQALRLKGAQSLNWEPGYITRPRDASRFRTEEANEPDRIED
jgi:hypothetical protein